MGGAVPDPPTAERDTLVAQLRRDIDSELDVSHALTRRQKRAGESLARALGIAGSVLT